MPAKMIISQLPEFRAALNKFNQQENGHPHTSEHLQKYLPSIHGLNPIVSFLFDHKLI